MEIEKGMTEHFKNNIKAISLLIFDKQDIVRI